MHTESSSPATPIRFYLYPLLIVALVGGIFSYFGLHSTGRGPTKSGSGGDAQPKVEPGKDYYVTVALAELTEKDGSGNPWDSLSESGPDIYVEIFWKGNRIYQSTTKQDTFVAKWSNADLNLRDMAIKGDHTSMDDVIRAARVNIKPKETIEIRVYDSDVVGSALAGTKSLAMTDLVIGDTVYELGGPGLKRMIVRVSNMHEAVDPLR